MSEFTVTIDGNEAAADVAHRLSEVIAIYPITPSSPMGEFADEWAAKGRPNLWGTIPSVTEMQSEAGAAAAVHGAAQAGALTTTFTASQGLLLMIPTMFKMAGELTPTVFHVTARTVATHALSIFGDHGDVMAVRSTGYALLASGGVQEVTDLACVAHAATLKSRVPFLHFFDGFRTSHEVLKVDRITDEQLRAMIDEKLVLEHRARAMNPEHPVLRGTAQNPDVFFQCREACNPYYLKCADIVQEAMDRFYKVVGRRYNLFDYAGAPDADRVVVIMASAGETVQETAEFLREKGEKVGVIRVRLYRPFDSARFLAALPKTVKTIGVLDRTKEPGALGEPLYQDVITALVEHQASGGNGFAKLPRVIGGRYGLSSKDFTPAMVKAVYDELKKPQPKNHFTVGIEDDVTHTSLPYDESFAIVRKGTVRSLFYGLGSDGTVGANKNSVKIIGEETPNSSQGYFVYDSKKAGAVTVSHLRFGPQPIHSTYLVETANFIACHQPVFLERYDMLAKAEPGSVFLLNTLASADAAWDTLPREVQKDLIDKKMKFYVIDAYKVAKETGMGERINTIMQTCFFAISGVLPRDEAIAQIKHTIKKTYLKKGEAVVQKNYEAVDRTLANLHEVKVPGQVTSKWSRPPSVAPEAPEFVRKVLGRIIENQGDALPVSAFPADGTFPVGTAQWEKRNIALEIPVWDPDTCIQCNKCSLGCPHAAIRPKVYDPQSLQGAPKTFKSTEAKGSEFKGLRYTLQIAPEDCTGCGLCVEVCPAKNKQEVRRKAINMAPQPPLRNAERENYSFFLKLPDPDRSKLAVNTVKGSQFLRPLFEYSGACAGCGETPYVKLLSQLFGDRAIIGNATGCSSIYSGNLPTTPYTVNADGRGPTWSNSLFEDAAEFAMGFRLCVDKITEFARELVTKLAGAIGTELVDGLLKADQTTEGGINAQRERVAALKGKLAKIDKPDAKQLLQAADYLIRRSVWGMGGDGWAYDIGYGGLDHVVASGRNVNLLVLDTEVYSNTGGQMSKSTPCGAVAKFAAAGRPNNKKDLGWMAMAYGNAYVAAVALGANDQQCVRAFVEAESYDGPSLLLCYAHCIAHGINMRVGMDHQKRVVQCGHWPLYRFDPRRTAEGLNPLQLDSKAPKIPFREHAEAEQRFRVLMKSDPERARTLMERAQAAVQAKFDGYTRAAQPWATSQEEQPQESAAAT
ncbi:MAG TPA: pyruvate:ferredoxin (flavodoxin) oxidoreductase [Phycisphaerae bacterium]|nr:pyruvate:ferredoxin (flavodoxin) oxidoreductase [Phycisphaerae bacterium]HNU45685.1 pyruvate:ferredoxin (flavodoxin) oxidoreductase [Phycisphaerae bacterium]